jgi:hypothetical protein
MTTQELYRTILEAAIRRLHLSGYQDFYIRDQSITLRDTNVMAWVADDCRSVRLQDADLAVFDQEGNPARVYVFHLLTPAILAGMRLTTRLETAKEQIRRLRVDPSRVLRVLVQSDHTSVPHPAPAALTTNATGVAVESLSILPRELVFDYLRMSKQNLFNASNTPAAPSLISEALGISEAAVLDACSKLTRDRKLEMIQAGSRRFFRVP